jgi:hypothetical protein
MKRTSTLLLAIAGLLTCGAVSAQSYEVGTNTVSAGIGLGSNIAGYTYGTQSPGWNFQYERGLAEAGPGVISGGLYVGFKNYKYEDPEGAYNYKWNYTIVGLRAAWHYTGLKIDNLDLYGGLMLSYNHLSVTYNSPQDIADPAVTGNYGSDLFLTPFVGARYYFLPGLAAFGELGYGVSTLNLGLAVKF